MDWKLKSAAAAMVSAGLMASGTVNAQDGTINGTPCEAQQFLGLGNETCALPNPTPGEGVLFTAAEQVVSIVSAIADDLGCPFVAGGGAIAVKIDSLNTIAPYKAVTTIGTAKFDTTQVANSTAQHMGVRQFQTHNATTGQVVGGTPIGNGLTLLAGSYVSDGPYSIMHGSSDFTHHGSGLDERVIKDFYKGIPVITETVGGNGGPAGPGQVIDLPGGGPHGNPPPVGLGQLNSVANVDAAITGLGQFQWPLTHTGGNQGTEFMFWDILSLSPPVGADVPAGTAAATTTDVGSDWYLEFVLPVTFTSGLPQNGPFGADGVPGGVAANADLAWSYNAGGTIRLCHDLNGTDVAGAGGLDHNCDVVLATMNVTGGGGGFNVGTNVQAIGALTINATVTAQDPAVFTPDALTSVNFTSIFSALNPTAGPFGATLPLQTFAGGTSPPAPGASPQQITLFTGFTPIIEGRIIRDNGLEVTTKKALVDGPTILVPGEPPQIIQIATDIGHPKGKWRQTSFYRGPNGAAGKLTYTKVRIAPFGRPECALQLTGKVTESISLPDFEGQLTVFPLSPSVPVAP